MTSYVRGKTFAIKFEIIRSETNTIHICESEGELAGTAVGSYDIKLLDDVHIEITGGGNTDIKKYEKTDKEQLNKEILTQKELADKKEYQTEIGRNMVNNGSVNIAEITKLYKSHDNTSYYVDTVIDSTLSIYDYYVDEKGDLWLQTRARLGYDMVDAWFILPYNKETTSYDTATDEYGNEFGLD